MKYLLVPFLLGSSYVLGDAPICAVDDSGNMNCAYYSFRACQAAVDSHYGDWVACVLNPNER